MNPSKAVAAGDLIWGKLCIFKHITKLKKPKQCSWLQTLSTGDPFQRLDRYFCFKYSFPIGKSSHQHTLGWISNAFCFSDAPLVKRLFLVFKIVQKKWNNLGWFDQVHRNRIFIIDISHWSNIKSMWFQMFGWRWYCRSQSHRWLAVSDRVGVNFI